MQIKELHNSWDIKPTSDFIKNRFDIIAKEYFSYEVISDNDTYVITSKIEGNKCNLGLNFIDIPYNLVEVIINFIFQNHRRVNEIRIDASLLKYGYSRPYIYYHISLPDTSAELHSRLSRKSNYNIKREQKLINESVGKVTFSEYTYDTIPDDVMNVYFEFKKVPYKTKYNFSKNDYLSNYNVSDCYVLSADNKILAIVLSCEQTNEVFLENLTYNSEFARYSPGQVLYDWYLTRLIEKGKTKLYLGGGDYMYKKRYGSISQSVYSNIIFRNYYYLLKYLLTKILRKIIVCFLNEQ